MSYRLLSDGVPKVDLFETTCRLVENFLAILKAENLFAQNEKLGARKARIFFVKK